MAELYRYPLAKLTSSDDYLKITAIEYVAPGFSNPNTGSFAAPTSGDPTAVGDSRDKKVEKAIFILPIPDDISQANTVTWNPGTLDPLQVGIAGLTEDIIKGNITKTIQGKFTSALGELTSGSSQRFAAAGAITFGINTLLDSNTSLSQNLSRYAGAIINPNIELLFTSVNLRNPFNFGFDMVPRSQKEAQMIREILRKFKQLSAAKNQGLGTGNGIFIKAPDVFKVEYMSGNSRHPYLNRFKICALTGVGINYTNGTYSTYPDGAPTYTKLSLGFQELSPIYAGDYDSEYGKEGTGF